jgi:hypothetical protein
VRLNFKKCSAIPRTEKIKLNSDLVELLDHYLKFYENKLGSSITTEQAIVEMITAFINSDRPFMRWFRGKDEINLDEKMSHVN